MAIKVPSEQQIIQEAWQVLANHLPASKVARFWAACQLGEGDYLKLKDQLFEQETVATLYEKVKAYQDFTSSQNREND